MTARRVVDADRVGAGAAYERGQLSPVEITEAALDAADAMGKALNAIASIDAARARQDARASEARWRAGTPRGPLDGVPISFKDSFHVDGLPRWHGTSANPGRLSAIDAAPVRRAREAGLIVVAKTTMPDFAMLMSGLSSQHGIIRNAWDPETNPGGSSAGAGPAVVMGVAPIAIGTDMVGSVRLPAALSGLASIKPTQGRIAYDPAGSYRSAGPMAKSVDDVEAALRILGRCDATDQFALPGAYDGLAQPFERLDGKRVGVLRRIDFGTAVDAETAAAVEAQAARLAARGAAIEEIADLAAGPDDYDAIYWNMLHRAIADYFGLDAAGRDRVRPEIRAMLDSTEGQSALFAARATKRIAEATDAIRRQLSRFDYVLSPALPVRSFAATDISPSPALGAMAHMGFACWFNQLGWPAGTVPVHQPPGGVCPVGVQVAAPRFRDAEVLQVMRLLEADRGFDIAWPGLRI